MDDATRARLDVVMPFGAERPLHWKLVGREVKPCKLSEWVEMFELNRKFTGRTWIGAARVGISVSTIFLGLDHAFGDGPPILFDTMIFYGYSESKLFGRAFHESVFMDRYSTYDDAELGHWAAVRIAHRAWTRSKRIGRARRRAEKPRFE